MQAGQGQGGEQTSYSSMGTTDSVDVAAGLRTNKTSTESKGDRPTARGGAAATAKPSVFGARAPPGFPRT